MSKRKAYIRTKYSVRKTLRFAKKHPVAAAIIAVLLLVLLIIASVDGNDTETEACVTEKPSASPTAAPSLREGIYVHYIDVGQGDCELVECDGEYMLIDAGDYSSGERVVSYLRSLGVTRLEYLVCSHGDSDHCGGLDEVADSFEVGTVFVSPYNEDKYAYGLFVETAEAKGLAAEVPELSETYYLGGAELRFLGPTVDSGGNNDNSLVLKVTYKSRVFLFAGDVERLGEEALFDTGAELKCDVLKVAHHGSCSSTSYRFLNAAMPSVAVISCGENNSYGHPHEEVLSRLSDAEVTVYRTDLCGTVIIHSDGESLERIEP